MKNEITVKDYFEPLCSNDIRLMLHISKRKAAYYLNNKYIPHINSGKKTRQYQVTVSDFIEYIEVGGPKVSERQLRINDLLTTQINVGFKDYLQEMWRTKPTVLTIYEAGLLVGYQTKTVIRWIKRKMLKAIYPQSEMMIPKDWLIEFLYMYGHTIITKSKRHINLIKNYYHK